jgi:hypothetical protein
MACIILVFLRLIGFNCFLYSFFMIFFLNPNYVIISYSFLSGLMILQTTFKSSSVILVLKWSSEGDQTAWRAGKKKSNLWDHHSIYQGTGLKRGLGLSFGVDNFVLPFCFL